MINTRSLNLSSITCLKGHFGNTKSDLHICLGLKKMPEVSRTWLMHRLEQKHDFLLLCLICFLSTLSCPRAEKLSDRGSIFLPPYNSVFFVMIPFYFGGLRLKTWDHAPSQPWLPLINLLCGRFCWTLVSCALLTLRDTHWQNPQLSAAPLPHTHDLNVTGGKKWAAGSWGQGRQCDVKCNQTFYQSSSTSEVTRPVRESQEWSGKGP